MYPMVTKLHTWVISISTCYTIQETACRVYAHALLVIDDNDFYQKQSMFTLAQQRAIATSLNALVFRTHYPVTPGIASS